MGGDGKEDDWDCPQRHAMMGLLRDTERKSCVIANPSVGPLLIQALEIPPNPQFILSHRGQSHHQDLPRQSFVQLL